MGPDNLQVSIKSQIDLEYTDSKGRAISIETQPFASGGEGYVHKIVGPTDYEGYCVKLYKGDKIKARLDKLSYMIEHPIKLSADLNYRICWPVDFVYLAGQVVGYIMQLAFEDSLSLYELYLKDDSEIFSRNSEKGIRNRLKLLYNVATSIQIVHFYNHIIADFKLQNVLYTQSGKISLIDMDSIQLSCGDKLLHKATAITPEYAYPLEINHLSLGYPLSKLFDSYSFAIVAYQILFGIHPFVAGYKQTNDYGELTDRIEAMKYGIYPLGRKMDYIQTVPRLHYYLYQLSTKAQNLFIETFELSKQIDITEWLDEFKSLIASDNSIRNPFFSNSKLPQILIKEKDIITTTGEFSLTWYCYNADVVYIGNNPMPISGINHKIIANSTNIEITANNAYGRSSLEVHIAIPSNYCISCGYKFYNYSDLYCTHCGAKKI